VSTAEIMNLCTSLPITATRFWLGSWQDSIRRISKNTIKKKNKANEQ
jgi:hypothetical protein